MIRRFTPEQYASALESWVWLSSEVRTLTPTHATAFGDLFLQGSDGGFWFLDTLEGSLERVWDTGADLQSVLNTPGGQDQFLMLGLVKQAAESGLTPGPDQVLSFKVPPVLGGPVGVDNVEVDDFVVSIGLTGQIHQQVRDLPPGAPVTGVSIG